MMLVVCVNAYHHMMPVHTSVHTCRIQSKILTPPSLPTTQKVPKINCDVAFHMAMTWYGDSVLEEMEEVTNELGVNSYKVRATWGCMYGSVCVGVYVWSRERERERERESLLYLTVRSIVQSLLTPPSL